MLFPMSDRAQGICRRVTEFMDAHIFAAEPVYAHQLDSGPNRWAIPPVIDELKVKADQPSLSGPGGMLIQSWRLRQRGRRSRST